jgi:DNA polymerase/3'-5' exonuclease PolX
MNGQYPDRPRIPAPIAKAAAEIIIERIRPFCHRVEIAGSLRRQARTVKDIEIVLIPRLEIVQEGLFGDPGPEVSLFAEKLALLVDEGMLRKAMKSNGQYRWGERHQAAEMDHDGHTIGIDFYSVFPPAQWGVQFAIRTGNYFYSRHLVTSEFHGGQMPAGMRVMEGALWRCEMDKERTPIGIINTPEEIDFFAAIGAKYLEPKDRVWKEPQK